MRLSSHTLTPRQMKSARKATHLRSQGRRLLSRFANTLQSPRGLGQGPAIRVSTFPKQFEGLRNQLFERAKQTPEFLATVFTDREGDAPTDDEILQSIENRLFTICATYPFWFSHTPDADAKAHELTRDHDINHGLIKAAPLTANQLAAVVRRKQERQERDERIAARVSETVAAPAS
ncbi:MAG TPA: hypothetical protein VGQ08_15770 [Nitrospiraceae bacterium]|jgi:hypothetical protein|nr:hypothetical protein [Nitrospiraceae bacterium]